MAIRENTDFLRFNAFAIKDLITRKLAQDSDYTDQIYPGSNLNILIDIVSYMYQTLMYNLNSAAAESMWADTKIYENINRLSQFLGYNPHGMNPSMAVFSIPTSNINIKEIIGKPIIPRYSYIDVGKTDLTGKKVYYSTVEDIVVDKSFPQQTVTLCNGIWRMYSTVNVAEGIDWETFTLNGLRSDSTTNDFVANNYIHVYVADPNGSFYRYNMTDGGLFKSRNEFFSIDNLGGSDSSDIPIPRIYNSEDRIFNLRLDETKTYTITFGNNRQGRRLTKGSSIYVFYLDSNAPGSDLSPGEVNGSLVIGGNSYQYSSNGRDYSNIYEKILNSSPAHNLYLSDSIEGVSNTSSNLRFSPEESVDQIRDFAPNWFRMGNRLVTQRDYEYFLNNSPAFRDYFADVKCMNNWEYMATFYKWLYEMGKKYQQEIDPTDKLGGTRFLRQDNVLKSTRMYADPADSNNIYLWVVSNQSGPIQGKDISVIKSSEQAWKNALLPIKDLTHEPYLIPAVKVKFAVCAASNYNYVRKAYLNTDPERSALSEENYIEVTIADEIIYANASIQAQIRNIVYNFFRSENFKIGQYVDFNLLQDQIFSINGVNRIRTVFKPIDSTIPVSVRNGICFASWTDDDVLKVRSGVEGVDLDVSSAGRNLEAFQFPELATSINSINVVVIKRSAASLNTVAY